MLDSNHAMEQIIDQVWFKSAFNCKKLFSKFYSHQFTTPKPYFVKFHPLTWIERMQDL